MGKHTEPDTRRKPHREVLAQYITVGTLMLVIPIVWQAGSRLLQIESSLTKFVDARIAIYKPTDEYIEKICGRVVEKERERTKEREQQLKESIEFLMRYYRRR